jgi:hypothetical protein
MLTKAIFVSLLVGALHAQAANIWEFPNFSDRIVFTVENPHSTPYDGVVVMKLSELSQRGPGFPGTLLLAVENRTPAGQLETQLDTARGEFAVRVTLAPLEKKAISIYYSATLHDEVPAIPHVHATHSYGYNRATVAIESESIGYRTYGGFFFDVQAHARAERGLFNTVLGYSSISHPPREGQDIVHLGETLGLGGLFLRSDNDVYRPPVNTPDYTHRPPKVGEPVYRVLASGPLRAIVEASVADWTIGEDHVALRAIYEIDAGQEVVHCHWWLTPLKLTRSYNVGAGIRDLPGDYVANDDLIVATDGIQEVRTGRIALGLSYGPDARRAGRLQTREGGNEIVLFRDHLTSGNSIEGEYTFAAAWQGSGWNDPSAHVREVLRTQSESVVASIGTHEINPNPKALEREPK